MPAVRGDGGACVCCRRLGVPPERCVVVEDSLIGLQAALGAGMPCVITYTPSTMEQDFAGARAVFPELGDGPGTQVTASQLMSLATTGSRPVAA